MSPLRVLIVDDEPLGVEKVLCALEAITGVQVVGTANGADAAADLVAREEPDLVFLDVNMPGRSGLQLARDLPQVGRPEIVIVTAFDTYAVAAFEIDAADFILKPFRDDRVAAAVHRARRRRTALRVAPEPPSPRPDPLWAKVRGVAVRIDPDQVEWMEAAGDYVIAHTDNRSYMLRGTLKDFEARLAGGAFLRAHRSALVATRAVEQIRKDGGWRPVLVLTSGAQVAVGDLYSADVLRRLKYA